MDTTEDFPFTFHFHALEKEMATHSSVLAWRIPGPVSLSVPKVELSGAKATVLMGSRDGFKADKTGDQKEEGSP